MSADLPGHGREAGTPRYRERHDATAPSTPPIPTVKSLITGTVLTADLGWATASRRERYSLHHRHFGWKENNLASAQLSVVEQAQSAITMTLRICRTSAPDRESRSFLQSPQATPCRLVRLWLHHPRYLRDAVGRGFPCRRGPGALSPVRPHRSCRTPLLRRERCTIRLLPVQRPCRRRASSMTCNRHHRVPNAG